MRYLIFFFAALFATPAMADIELQFLLGSSGDAEFDKLEIKQGERNATVEGNDTDLESGVSVAAAFTFGKKDGFQLGPRIGLTFGEPDVDGGPEQKFRIIDGGIWLRRQTSLDKKFGAFFGLGGGASYAHLESDSDELPELTGFGFHALIGAGIQVELQSTTCTLGVYYSYHNIPEIEGKKDGRTVTMKDATISQVMVGGGFTF